MTLYVKHRGANAAGAINNAAVPGEWVSISGVFNCAVSGDFSGALRIERSFDGGVTAIPVTLLDGTVKQFTTPDSIVIDEPEETALYRFRATSLSSGTAAWRFGK